MAKLSQRNSESQAITEELRGPDGHRGKERYNLSQRIGRARISQRDREVQHIAEDREGQEITE